MPRERHGRPFYSEALKQASSAPVRELLEQLKELAYKHVRIVEQKLAELRLA